MNYRHLYHAGSFADVFKHLILIELLDNLLQKDKPLTYFETHAGIGLYDLSSEIAQKTKEYASGINILRAQQNPPAFIQRFLTLCDRLGENYYPGSPLIAAQLVRADDRLILCELHTSDFDELKATFKNFGFKNAGLHHLNGYQGIKALTPPTPRRGLMLIDPPFEKESEIDDLIAGLKLGLARWPNATYVVWYPIKNTPQHKTLLREIAKLNLETINSDIIVDHDPDSTKLIGCGMLIINPPWQCENAIRNIENYLKSIF